MGINVNNVELGEGTLYVMVTLPNAETVEVDVGATLGAELAFKKEFKDVECGQRLSPILSFMTGEEGTFKVTMKETTMRNLALAMGLEPAGAGVSSTAQYTWIRFGGETANVYAQLRYVVAQQADATKNWEFLVYKARAISGLVLPFAKEDERSFEVEFKMYPSSVSPYYLGDMKKYI